MKQGNALAEYQIRDHQFNRIVGGTDAEIENIPWMVSLARRMVMKGRQVVVEPWLETSML